MQHTGHLKGARKALTNKQTPWREKAHGTALLSVRLDLHSSADLQAKDITQATRGIQAGGLD